MHIPTLYRILALLLLLFAALAGCEQEPREAALSDLSEACELPIKLAGANGPVMNDCTGMVMAIQSCPQITTEEIRGLATATRDAAMASDLPSFTEAAGRSAAALPAITAKLAICRIDKATSSG